MRHWFWILLITLGLQAQEARIQILGTTDMHGHVRAEDTFSLQPMNQGWAKVTTLIRRQKVLNPNTILLDCGDTIQIQRRMLPPGTARQRMVGRG